jgi:hypothetical protein
VSDCPLVVVVGASHDRVATPLSEATAADEAADSLPELQPTNANAAKSAAQTSVDSFKTQALHWPARPAGTDLEPEAAAGGASEGPIRDSRGSYCKQCAFHIKLLFFM